MKRGAKSVKTYPLTSDPERESESSRYADPIPSRRYIMQFLIDRDLPASQHVIASAFELTTPSALLALKRRLRAMEKEGQLIKNRRGAYGLVARMDLVKGRVIGHRDGYGFLTGEAGQTDLFLAPQEMKKVMHGDLALAHVSRIDRKGRLEGEIVEILEFANSDLVGRLHCEKNVFFVEPDNKKITQPIMIASEDLHGAKPGQMVTVALQRETATAVIWGKVSEILGDELQSGVEIDVAIRTHGIPYLWPETLEEELAQWQPRIIPPEAINGRLDLRNVPLVTIDGEDAKDFDDAVFVQPLAKGGFELYVAIADVSYYVKPGSLLDQAALERATSVYFPARVVPMLPPILSDDLCSLKPRIDRLCLVAIMQIDARGLLRGGRFERAIMHSHARLTYTKVAEILQGQTKKLTKDELAIVPQLKHLHALYLLLRKQRDKRGAIDFDSVESRFVFDKTRRVKNIIPLVRNDAHKIIEECMILANVAAAQFLHHHAIRGPFRLHDSPSVEKTDDLQQFLHEFGLRMSKSSTLHPADYARLVAQVAGKPYARLVSTVLLRSLKQAIYGLLDADHEPEEHPYTHFGLALSLYTHFTSPIRRYPDLLVHRAIMNILTQTSSLQNDPSHLRSLCEHCSFAERRADDATRDVEMRLKCEFMADKVGAEYPGIVSGVTSFGLFIELSDLFVEGLLHVTSLPNDYYHFDPIHHRLTGERGGLCFRLGDPIRVQVLSANPETRQIDLALVAAKSGSFRPTKK